MELTQERVREVLDYDDGILRWKKRISRRGVLGKEPGGTNPGGYKFFMLDGRTRLAHRVIFLWHHGYMPKEIDHADGNKLNNRIENLRPSTKSENCCNRHMRSDNKSGFKGVYWHKDSGKWRAEIGFRGKKTQLGAFACPEDAAKAYAVAALQLHGDFVRL